MIMIAAARPAAKAYRTPRKPAIRRPGLRNLIADRFRLHPDPAQVYMIYSDRGYQVRAGWRGEDLAYRLLDEDTREVSLVTGNGGRFRCTCEKAARFPRKRCDHVLAILSAFEHVGELPPELPYGDSWETWRDEDADRWTVVDPDLDLDEP